MGDSILTSLSLPPSGKMASNQTEEGVKFSTDPWRDTQHRSPFIAPVFGTISNKDVPIMSSKCKGTAAAGPLLTAVKHKSNMCEESIEKRTSKSFRRIKRRPLDTSDSEEAGDVFDMVGNEKNEKSKDLQYSARRLQQESPDDSSDENHQDGAGAKSSLGVHLPPSPSTRSTVLSCLHSKPKVVLRRLSVTTRGGKVVRKVSPVKTSAWSRACSQHPKSDVDFSSWRNKE